VVVVLENGDRILANGAVDAQADPKVLAQTGSSPKPVWLTGLACLVSGALALTFKRRRHLSLYTLRSKRS
jgi:LPXTG-motif cell wall-anchored protein